MTAYMLWLQDTRSKIKAENPGISVTEVSKIAGAMWKTVATPEKKVFPLAQYTVHFADDYHAHMISTTCTEIYRNVRKSKEEIQA